MPVISRTERQVGTNATPQPYSSGEGYQAIGQGIKQLGQGLEKLGNRADENEDFKTKMAVSEYTFNKAKEEDERAANYTPEKHGPPAEYDTRFNEERAASDKEFMSQFKTPRSQQYAAQHLQQSRQQAALRAQNHRQGFVQQETIGLVQAQTSRVASTVTGEFDSVFPALQAVDAAVREAPGLTIRQRAALREHAAEAALDAWEGKATWQEKEKRLQEMKGSIGKWLKGFQGEEGDKRSAIENKGEHSIVSAGSGAKFRVASPYADRFAGLIADLEAEGVEVKGDQSGGYAKRNIAGTNTPSRHSHGEAIDINWTENARGARGEMAKRLGPEKINEIAARHGMTWGGNWRNPDDMHFEIDRKAKVEARPRAAPAKAAGGPLTGTPIDETGGDGGNAAFISARDRLKLPDHATMGDHVVKRFLPRVDRLEKQIQAGKADEQGKQYIAGVISGEIPFNKYDTENRKVLNKAISDTGLGERISAGDPKALLAAGQISVNMRDVPQPVYAALHGLTEHQDPKMRALGWQSISNLVSKDPHILGANSGADALAREAAKMQVLADTHGWKKAMELDEQYRTPEAKRVREAAKKTVDVFMKTYEKPVEDVGKLIGQEMGPSWWQLWSTSPTTGEADLGRGDPKVGLTFQQKAAIVADYKDLLKLHFENTGDADTAKIYAKSDMGRRHGETYVTGRNALMPYPPEAFYRPLQGKGSDPNWGHKYIHDAFVAEGKTYGLKPETMGLVADRQTKQEVQAGAPPTYQIQGIRESDGSFLVVPERFNPDKFYRLGGGREEHFKELQRVSREDREKARANPPPPLGEMGVP